MSSLPHNRLALAWWLLPLLLVALRLPNLNRPLSKHHEFNTAVILINAESWRQMGGAAATHGVPVMNYADEGNRLLQRGPHTDAAGNHVYLSFGPGWYWLPWLMWQATGMDPSPLSLQLLNILISLLTAWLIRRLLLRAGRSGVIATGAAWLYMLLPAPLWYGGNGYVNTMIALPLLLWLLDAWRRLQRPRAGEAPPRYWEWILAGLLLVYVEWLGVFLLCGFAATMLWQHYRGHKAYAGHGVVCLATAMVATVLVFAQFAAHVGWQQTLQYWTERAAGRSLDSGDAGWTGQLQGIARNLLTGYWPLLIPATWLWLQRQNLSRSAAAWMLTPLYSLLAYNLVFLNWSAAHEFAWLALALCLVLWTACLLPSMTDRIFNYAVLLAVGASVITYYVINRPGDRAWNGDRYTMYRDAGEAIRMQAGDMLPIFTDTDNQKIVEYYAKRTFQWAASEAEAIRILRENGRTAGWWLSFAGDGFRPQLRRLDVTAAASGNMPE